MDNGHNQKIFKYYVFIYLLTYLHALSKEMPLRLFLYSFSLSNVKTITFFVCALSFQIRFGHLYTLIKQKWVKKCFHSALNVQRNGWSIIYKDTMMNYSRILKAFIYSNSIYFICSISPLNIGQCFVFTNSALILSSRHSVTSIIYCI